MGVALRCELCCTRAVLEIVYKTLDQLKPYSGNARTHSPAQVKAIARSISEFGFTNPILIDKATGKIIAGHGRLMAAQELALTEVPTIEISGLTDEKRRALILADNRLPLDAGWDTALLAEELSALQDVDFDLSLTGFTDEEIDAILNPEIVQPDVDADEVPEEPRAPRSVTGDIWLCGKHRVMCGDLTSVDDVAKLMNGSTAQLLHADPPYGMGKQVDGVAGDNQYNEDLDRFQMEWWTTFRTFIVDNASVYIWGNAPELWRLWYSGGLSTSEKMEFCNEIVWNKKFIPGMKSPEMTQYPNASERCLFFKLGEQYRGNINTDDFPETWEPIRSYFENAAEAAGISSSDIKRICGVSMYSHWFTRSQYTLMPENHYNVLVEMFPDCFTRPWRELKREWDKVKSSPTSEIQEKRSYFDNAHDVMADVWEFDRVVGEERHGHATPKPVAMMERIMMSSLRKGEICAEPFGGLGSTLIGAQKTGRVCYTMELQPRYVDVIVQRWQNVTGEKAVHAVTGEHFDDKERVEHDAAA